MDFDIRKCTRRCAASDRELAANEAFYSVLVRAGARLVRQDYSASSWAGPPSEAVACWKSCMPSAEKKRMKLAPNEVMLALLEELEAEPDKQHLRYLLALMLVRRRAAQMLDNEMVDDCPCLVLQPPKREEVRVPIAEPLNAAHADELQEELIALLYAEEG